MLVMRRIHWPLVVGLVCLLVLVLASLTMIPQLLYPRLTEAELRAVRSPETRIQLQQAQSQLQNGARSTLLQAIAGLLVVTGAVATWRQVQVNREGQITERFTRAIDQLGSETVDIRLGGLYALERIAKDSPNDRSTITSILTAFVRSHAPLSTAPESSLADTEVPWLQIRATDVQAALKILGQRQSTSDEQQLYLSYTDLRKARITDGRWAGVECRHADLAGARMKRALLDGADLTDTNLRQAGLDSARLMNASLKYTRLEGASLRGADLRGADLRGASLDGADLAEIRVDETTRWPDGFDVDAARYSRSGRAGPLGADG